MAKEIKDVYSHMLKKLQDLRQDAKESDQEAMLRLCYAMWIYSDKVAASIRTARTSNDEKGIEKCLKSAYESIKKLCLNADLSQLFLSRNQNVWQETDFEFYEQNAATGVENYMAAAMVDIQDVYNKNNMLSHPELILEFAGKTLIGNKNYPNTTGMTTDTVSANNDKTPTPVGMTTFTSWIPVANLTTKMILNKWLNKRTDDDLFEYGGKVHIVIKNPNPKLPDIVLYKATFSDQLKQYGTKITSNQDHQMAEYHKKVFWQKVISEISRQKMLIRNVADQANAKSQSVITASAVLFGLLNEIKQELGINVAVEDIRWITTDEIKKMLTNVSYATKPIRAATQSVAAETITIPMANLVMSWQKFGFTINQLELTQWLADVKWTGAIGKVDPKSGLNGPLKNKQGFNYDLARIVGSAMMPTVYLKKR